MATLKPVIVPAKVLRGGRHKIRISVSHNGDFRYIVTDITIDSAKEFKNGQIVKRPDAAFLNTKLRGLLQRYQESLDKIEYTGGLTCAELVSLMKNAGNSKRRTLASVFEDYIGTARVKPSTKETYRTAFSSIEKFFGESALVENISHSAILGLDRFLREDAHLSPTTIRFRFALLSALINHAKRCGYAKFAISPFEGFSMPEPSVRQSWLSVDEVKAIRDFKTDNANLSKCRDIFMLSYYLGGINMADLLEINFNEQTDTIRFVRKKTENRRKLNKYVEFGLPDEAKPIIERYKGEDGRIMFGEKQRATRYRRFLYIHLKALAAKLGISCLIYYSARKSFSQHAFDIGIDTSTIDYILGHRVDKVGTSLYNYISVTPEKATEAVRKVLDNLR